LESNNVHTLAKYLCKFTLMSLNSDHQYLGKAEHQTKGSFD
jgi:hypothetical protein